MGSLLAHFDGGIAKDMSTNFGMTINGVAVAGAGNAAFDVVNPATGDVFAQAPECSREQLDTAVETARAAFPAWRNRPIDERAELLNKAADVLAAEAEDMARLFTKEQGLSLIHI